MNESARRLAVAGTNQDQDYQESAGRLAAENSEIIDDDDSEWPNNYHISRAYVPHLEKVCSNLRQQPNRKPEDRTEGLDVNTLIWRMFMTVTLQAAVRLGNDYLENLHSTKNQPQRRVKQLFDATIKLVRDQKEIQGISVINWQDNSWKMMTFLTDRAVRLSTAKVYVFSCRAEVANHLHHQLERDAQVAHDAAAGRWRATGGVGGVIGPKRGQETSGHTSGHVLVGKTPREPARKSLATNRSPGQRQGQGQGRGTTASSCPPLNTLTQELLEQFKARRKNLTGQSRKGPLFWSAA